MSSTSPILCSCWDCLWFHVRSTAGFISWIKIQIDVKQNRAKAQYQQVSKHHLEKQTCFLSAYGILIHLKLPLKFKMEVLGTKSRAQYGRREFSMSMTELDKLFRSFLRVECLCHWHSSSSTCSRKKLVVRVYRMGFKALLMGRMKITTHDVMVP